MKYKKLIQYSSAKKTLTLILCSTLPLVSIPAIAKKSEKERIQVNGYLGKTSQRAIEAGMLDRLTSNIVAEQLDMDTGDAATDLKTRVDFWHKVALDTVALDHTSDGDDGAPVNNGGPTRTSRAMAMIQILSLIHI